MPDGTSESKNAEVRADPEAARAQTVAENGIPDKPMLGIDPAGNMTLFVPMAATNEIFARGMVDMARTSLLKWYAEKAAMAREKQIDIARLAQKTGFQRFKDKLVGIGPK